MNTWRIQGLRYIIVGLASNLVLYVVYLFFTMLGMGHKTAMTLLYVIGTLQTFIFNKRWTFSHVGNIQKSMMRYFAAYGGCYVPFSCRTALLGAKTLGFYSRQRPVYSS